VNYLRSLPLKVFTKSNLADFLRKKFILDEKRPFLFLTPFGGFLGATGTIHLKFVGKLVSTSY